MKAVNPVNAAIGDWAESKIAGQNCEANKFIVTFKELFEKFGEHNLDLGKVEVKLSMDVINDLTIQVSREPPILKLENSGKSLLDDYVHETELFEECITPESFASDKVLRYVVKSRDEVAFCFDVKEHKYEDFKSFIDSMGVSNIEYIDEIFNGKSMIKETRYIQTYQSMFFINNTYHDDQGIEK